MADIHPFRAFRYDPRQVSLSPGCDPALRQDHSQHCRIAITRPARITSSASSLAAAKKLTIRTNNVYSRAAAHFRDWRRQGILRQDSDPSVYIYSQRFTLPGSTKELERRGFIALGRIEDYSAAVVFRHEQTLAKPKADRLDLLRATRAHFGQIFVAL